MKWILNITSNYLRFIINMVVVFFLTPFIIKMLGMEAFGLWSLVYAVVGVVGLLDMGFATAAVKYVAEAVGAKDNKGLNSTVSTLAAIYSLLGLLCLVLVLLLAGPVSALFSIDAEMRETFSSVLMVIGIAVAFSFPLSIFKSILIGSGRHYEVNLVDLITLLGNAGLVIYLLNEGHGLQGMAWSAASMMVLNLLILVPLARRAAPHITISPTLFSMPQVRELASFSVYAFTANVAVLIILKIDPIVIGMFLPLSAIAIYAIAGKIGEYTYLFNKQFSNGLMPLVSQAKGRDDDQLIHRVLIDGTRFLMAIALPFIALLFYYTPEIIDIWVGDEFAAAAPLLRILLLAVLFSTIQLNAANVLAMTGQHKSVARAMLGSAALNLILSVILIQFIGLTGVAMGTLISAFLIEMLVIVPLGCRNQSVGWSEFLMRGIFPAVPAALPMFLVAWGFSSLAAPQTLILIVLEGGVSALIYFLIFGFTGVTRQERQALVARLRRRDTRQGGGN